MPAGLLIIPSRSVQPPLHPTLDRTAFDVLLLSMFALSYRYLNASAEDPDYVTEAERLLGVCWPIPSLNRIHTSPASTHGRSHALLCQALLLLGYRNIGIGSCDSNTRLRHVANYRLSRPLGCLEASWMYTGGSALYDG